MVVLAKPVSTGLDTSSAGLLGSGHGPMCARAACGTHGLPFIHRPALPSGAAGAALAALLVAILSREATAGKCIEPPKGATAFCGQADHKLIEPTGRVVWTGPVKFSSNRPFCVFNR